MDNAIQCTAPALGGPFCAWDSGTSQCDWQHVAQEELTVEVEETFHPAAVIIPDNVMNYTFRHVRLFENITRRMPTTGLTRDYPRSLYTVDYSTDVFVTVKMTVQRGRLHLPDYNGMSGQAITFTDHVVNASNGIKTIVYERPPYWHGDDLISFE